MIYNLVSNLVYSVSESNLTQTKKAKELMLLLTMSGIKFYNLTLQFCSADL